MQQQTDAKVYREVAKFVEDTALEALTAYSEISFTPVVGDLQYFPRPTGEARAAERGFSLLQEQIDEVVAILYALAAAADNNLPVPPVLEMRVKPYVEAFQQTPVKSDTQRQSRKK